MDSRRMRIRVMAGMVMAVLAVGAVGCSSSSSSGSSDGGSSHATDQVEPTTEEELVDWIGKAHEVVVACHEATRSTDGILDGHSEAAQGGDESIDAVLAAGQAVEHCGFALDEGTAVVPAEELGSIWTQGTAALAAWLDEMEATHRTAVVVAAGNIDNRALVGELFDHQAAADARADELDVLLAQRAEAVGVDAPDGLGLHRWDPPEH